MGQYMTMIVNIFEARHLVVRVFSFAHFNHLFGLLYTYYSTLIEPIQ